MNILTILLVEDDPVVAQAYYKYVDRLEDAKIIETVNGATEAVQSIRDNLPDAVILDLELQNGDGTGIDVLKALQTAELPKRPFILVVSDYVNGPIRSRVQTLGADFVFWKKQKGFSEQYAVDFLRDMSDSIHEAGSQGMAQTIETPRQREERMMEFIKTELLAVGITPRMKGYQYLADAIALYIRSPQRNLAAVIAQEHKAARSAVTRAMEYAIDQAWRTTDIDILNEHYKARIRSDTGVPTVLEFVYYYADQVKRRI